MKRYGVLPRCDGQRRPTATAEALDGRQASDRGTLTGEHRRVGQQSRR
jgi:hypothetical protein